MDQHAGALDMAEEAVADAGAFMGALDQPGNIGQHKVALADRDDAKVGMERGEGIIGDLGLGRRDRREEGRFAGIGQADQSGVGDQLQPQPDPLLGAFLAGVGVARRLVGRGLEMGVAEAAIAAGEQRHGLADRGEVGDQRLVVVLEDLRADGDAKDHVIALGAVAVLAHAVGAGRGLEVLLVAVVDEGIEPVDALHDDVAAAAAIAAIGAAELDEFLAQEADRTGATVAGADKDLGLIEKFHRVILAQSGQAGEPDRASVVAECSAQRARVNWVSIWRTSCLRARQSSRIFRFR